MNTLIVFTVLASWCQAPDESPQAAWRRAHEAHQRGNLQGDEKALREAEVAYRQALSDWPDSQFADTTREGLGDVLLALKRYPEAREILIQMTAEDARRPGTNGRPIRPELFVKIGKSYESEADWGKALEAYQAGAQRGAFDFGGCGTCEDQKALSSQTRLVRCLYHLGRDQDALQICRDVIFNTDGGCGGRRTELCIIAVDAAIRSGRLDELERDLVVLPKPKIGGNHAAATQDYLRILRLRGAGDIEGLFNRFIAERHTTSLHKAQFHWDQVSHGPSLVIEAAECLAELGDPAFARLESAVRNEGDLTAQWAVIAMAHFRDDRARAIARNPPWRPRDPRAAELFIGMLEGIASESPRRRHYPPSQTVPGRGAPWVIGAIVGGLLVAAGVFRLVRARLSNP